MKWISENKGYLRLVVLVLLVVALLGPWVFDQINVPAQYPCSEPFIRLEGDYCGIPLSGTWILFAGLTGWISALFSGEWFTAQGLRLFLVFVLILLPVVSTAVLLLTGNRRGWVGFQIAAFVLALGLVLLSGLLTEASQYWVLWGVWLYVGVTAAALLLEGVMWVWRRRAGMG